MSPLEKTETATDLNEKKKTKTKGAEGTRPIFLSLNLLTIYELNSYLLALFVYSYFRGQLPPSFSDFFSEKNTIHSYNTRSANKVYIKYGRLNYRRFSVRYIYRERCYNIHLIAIRLS